MLYADISGFTEYSRICQQEGKPEKVIEMLGKLFTKFDKECHSKGCYKVYTIGDCYVAMGFTDSSKRNPP